MLGLPFAGMLLSIALGPLVVKEWWHIHYEKAAAFWALLTLAGLLLTVGAEPTAAALVRTIALEYLPFIAMLFALYTTAGGICIEGEWLPTPLFNTSILVMGALTASVIGTTCASMILIRPLFRANLGRTFGAHLGVFFIFIVSNIGGSLSPLGDPPLFLGFLLGIDFFWPLRALWPATLFSVSLLLLLFFAADSYLFSREMNTRAAAGRSFRLGKSGLANAALIALAVAIIAVSGVWHSRIGFDILGTRMELQNIVRECSLLAIGLASIRFTSPAVRAANDFDWEPIREVAYLFAGIFISIIPVMTMLHAGVEGPFHPAIGLLHGIDGAPISPAYFWATGLLSSFLDNAPTYRVFFELAGGNPDALMGPYSKTLQAISLGAVFMGANTYIGNAPNFMVYAIARQVGFPMPSFFGYMIWSGNILLPLFGAVTWLFFM